MIVFGPVHSRRFGLSLGIDLSPFKKQCNFDCIYCELNANKPMQKQDEIVDLNIILDEIKNVLNKNIKFDYLTITANGEPSLYPYLNELILELNKIKKDKKILILSNGSAVLDDDKFQALLKFDVVKLSLDSVIEKTFYKIDKALKYINLNLMIKKMIDFKSKFNGSLIMEILVVKDINDKEEEFIKLNEILNILKPQRVDISTIDRPPAYPVKSVDEKRLDFLASFIKNIPVCIAKRKTEKLNLDFDKEEIEKMLCLRAQSEFDIENNFSDFSKKNLKSLIKENKVKILDLSGVKFYKI